MPLTTTDNDRKSNSYITGCSLGADLGPSQDSNFAHWICYLCIRICLLVEIKPHKSQLELAPQLLFHGDIWFMEVFSSVRIWTYLLHGAVVHGGVRIGPPWRSLEDGNFFSTEAMGDCSGWNLGMDFHQTASEFYLLTGLGFLSVVAGYFVYLQSFAKFKAQ